MTGAALIAAERQRQIDAEGWTTEHDDAAHDSGELVYAAISYAYSPFSDVRQAPDDDYRKPPGTVAPSTWPWEDEWWKPTPKDRVRELTKAGALIAAEIDRLQRAGTSVVYDGTFDLAWLAEDEKVCSAGDGSGACLILSPRGDLRVDIGDLLEVPRGR